MVDYSEQYKEFYKMYAEEASTVLGYADGDGVEFSGLLREINDVMSVVMDRDQAHVFVVFFVDG